ncbi:MAG: AmmeMemoRadiSam system radical SAM enzyme [bacterium]
MVMQDCTNSYGFRVPDRKPAFEDSLSEAKYWQAEEGGSVRCGLCPRRCLIKGGELGYCGIRLNLEGALFTTVYARPAAVAVDPIEKKPLYHFHPGSKTLSVGTIGCNLKCVHCQNCDISYARYEADVLARTSRISAAELIALIASTGSRGIAFTYNEPTIWVEYVLDVFAAAKEAGYYTALVTNAYIEDKPLSDLLKVTDAYRADLKFLNPESARKIAGFADTKIILKRIEKAVRAGAHVEVVTNIIPGYNDSPGELGQMAKWIFAECGRETPWHLTRSFPQENWRVPPTPMETLRKAIQIGRDAGLSHVYPGNVVGMDSDTLCPNCGAIVIERDGYSARARSRLPYCGQCGYRLNIVA